MAKRTYANALAALNTGTYATTIDGQIQRIEDSEVVIIHKTDELGITPGQDDKISDAALAIDGIVDRGTPTATIDAGTTYTIQAGYYHGGTVSYQQGGSDYQLQNKSATPTKSEQVLGPDDGYYGLRQVTIAAIPDAYQDVSDVTATAADVKTGVDFVDSHGNVVNGSMPVYSQSTAGTVIETLTAHKTSDSYDDYYYDIPAGYHNGNERVAIDLESRTDIILTGSVQDITPSTDKVLGLVRIPAVVSSDWLPGWTNDSNASAADILTSKSAYVKGVKVNGEMVNNGAVSHTLTADTDATVEYIVPQGYHTGTGKVKIVPEDKTVTAAQIEGHAAITITASSGKVLREVSIAALPADWVSTAPGTGETAATGADMLSGKVAFVNGAKITGTITQVTSWSDPDVTSEILGTGASGGPISSFNEAFYKNGGSVSIGSSLYTRLAAI